MKETELITVKKIKFITLSFMYIITLFIIYKYYFDTSIIHYCDDGDRYTLHELKVNLTLETVNYRSAHINYECYVDLHNQAIEHPVRDYNREGHILNLARNKMGEMRISLNKIRELEALIREIQPDFISPVDTIRYPRVSNR